MGIIHKAFLTKILTWFLNLHLFLGKNKLQITKIKTTITHISVLTRLCKITGYCMFVDSAILEYYRIEIIIKPILQKKRFYFRFEISLSFSSFFKLTSCCSIFAALSLLQKSGESGDPPYLPSLYNFCVSSAWVHMSLQSHALLWVLVGAFVHAK